MMQEAVVAAAVWLVFTALAVLAVRVTWACARRDARNERSREAAQARRDAEGIKVP